MFAEYDVVSIGGGLAGAALAKVLAEHRGVRNVDLVNNGIHPGNGLTFAVNGGDASHGLFLTQVTFELPSVFSLDLELRLAADAIPERYRSFFVTPSFCGNLLGQRRGSAARPVSKARLGRFSQSSEADLRGTESKQQQDDGRRTNGER